MRGNLIINPLGFQAPVRHNPVLSADPLGMQEPVQYNPVLSADDELQLAILQIYFQLSSRCSLFSGDLPLTEPRLQMAVSAYEGIVQRMIRTGDEQVVFSLITSTFQRRLLNFSTALLSSSFKGLLFLEKIYSEWDTFCRAKTILVQPFKPMEDGSLAVSPPFSILEGKILSLWTTIMLTTDQMKMNFEGSLLHLLRHLFDKRYRETLDTGMIHAIQGTLRMLVILDVRLYQQSFEGVYLEHASSFCDYYSQRFRNLLHHAQSRVQKDNITPQISVLGVLRLHLQKVETFLQNDTARVIQLLPLETKSKFQSIFQTKMIQEHLDTILDGLPNMLRWNKCKDLKRISNLLAGLPSQCLQRMCEIVSTHMFEEGRDILDQAKDPLGYVGRLVQLTLRYEKLSAESFQGEVSLTEAVASALKRLIGLNTSTTEFIALFLDYQFRKNFDNIFLGDSEEFLDGIVSVLRYLDRNDLFVWHFEKHLQIRFLSGCARSPDVERKVVTKLAKHGFEYSGCKLQDIQLSIDPTRNSGFVVDSVVDVNDSVVDVNYPKSSVQA